MTISFITKPRKYVYAFLLSISTIVAFAQNNKEVLKTIQGTVTYLGAPMSNVNISIQDAEIGTTTNSSGEYSIRAKVGDVINYSYVGFNTISIIVEDMTSVLNIEMTEKVNELNETVVTARKVGGTISELAKEKSRIIKTAIGNIDFKRYGFNYEYLRGKDLNKSTSQLGKSLDGKFSGVECKGKMPCKLLVRGKSVIWDVDGQIFSTEPQIDMSLIEDIYILKNAPVAYGHKSVVIVRTKMSPDVVKEKKEAKAEQYRNQNYYNDDATTIATNEIVSTSNSNTSVNNSSDVIKEIIGKVTYLETPLPNVNIIIVGKTTGTNTDTKGEYSIKATVGDIIQFSHLGFATVSIIIEDVTNRLDIEMVLEENELDEVLVESDGSVGKNLELDRKANEDFSTSRGNMDPKRTGFTMSFLDGEEVSTMYLTLGEAIAGKIPGVRYDQETKKVIVKPRTSINTPVFPIWDIDGVIYNEEPPMDLSNIKSVRVLKTLAGTNRYGSDGAGGVILVQTKSGNFNPVEAKRKKVAEQYTNKNYYSNDATVVNSQTLSANSFAEALEAFNNKQKAFIYYDQTLKKQVNDYSDHISIALKFVSFYKDKNLAKEVLLRLTETYNKNPEILKAVAYHFQALNFKKEAVKTYEAIFKLRPSYAQSYRDLANAYVNNDQYQKAWRLYMSYLLQGHDLSGEGIGQLFYKEMEWLYFNRKNQTQIKQKFQPLSENLADFRDDIRLVFEWNTSEAEFDIEFVNPEQRSYVFEHTLAANQDLITDEKTKGYSSSSYFIDDVGEGEWLVNLTYKGNKTPRPTYFKLTTYYNWGKTNQKKKVTVYRLRKQQNKLQLLRLNKQLLEVTN